MNLEQFLQWAAKSSAEVARAAAQFAGDAWPLLAFEVRMLGCAQLLGLLIAAGVVLHVIRKANPVGFFRTHWVKSDRLSYMNPNDGLVGISITSCVVFTTFLIFWCAKMMYAAKLVAAPNLTLLERLLGS